MHIHGFWVAPFNLYFRHDRVKRWTRKVNIFEKDFVVIPINENYHWYLCIICYPGQVCHMVTWSLSECSALQSPLSLGRLSDIKQWRSVQAARKTEEQEKG